MNFFRGDFFVGIDDFAGWNYNGEWGGERR